MPIYLWVEGIKGPINRGKEPKTKWIELESAQLGMNRSVQQTTGSGGSGEPGVPSSKEITVTKLQDVASTALFKLSIAREGRKACIEFVKTDANNKEPAPYMTIELEKVLIVSYSVSGHGGDQHSPPYELLTLIFTKMTFNADKAPGGQNWAPAPTDQPAPSPTSANSNPAPAIKPATSSRGSGGGYRGARPAGNKSSR